MTIYWLLWALAIIPNPTMRLSLTIRYYTLPDHAATISQVYTPGSPTMLEYRWQSLASVASHPSKDRKKKEEGS